MDDPEVVGVRQSVATLDGDAARLVDGERPLALQAAGEALAHHVLHHEEVAARFDEEIVDQDEIRVAKPDGDARLALEACRRLGHREEDVAANHLEGARLVQQDVQRLVHGAHPAAPDALDDLEIADLLTQKRIRRVLSLGGAAHGIVAYRHPASYWLPTRAKTTRSGPRES